MMNVAIVTFKLLLFIAISFAGQTSAFAITTAKEQDIKKLMLLMDISNLEEQMADMLITSVISIEKSRNPDLPDSIEKVLSDTIHEVVTEEAPELDKVKIPMYDKYYTHSEIKQLIDFFESPIGQKYSDVLMPMTQELMLIGQSWGKKVAQIAAGRVQQKLEQMGYK